MLRSRLSIGALAFGLMFGQHMPAHAIDPAYQPEMERLAEIMGALYHLDDLCLRSGVDWRLQLAELMDLDEVDDDRRERLAGAFNANYADFQQTHSRCTDSATLLTSRFLEEGAKISYDIHIRYAE